MKKYISEKQIELDKLTNVVLFKFIYFFQIIGIFISFYYYFLVSTFSGTHVRTVCTGSYATEVTTQLFAWFGDWSDLL